MEKRPINEDAAGLLKLMRLLSDDAELDLIENIFRGSSSLTSGWLGEMSPAPAGRR